MDRNEGIGSRLRHVTRSLLYHLLILVVGVIFVVMLLCTGPELPQSYWARVWDAFNHIFALDFGASFLRGGEGTALTIAVEGLFGSLKLIGLSAALAIITGWVLSLVWRLLDARPWAATRFALALLVHSATVLGLGVLAGALYVGGADPLFDTLAVIADAISVKLYMTPAPVVLSLLLLAAYRMERKTWPLVPDWRDGRLSRLVLRPGLRGSFVQGLSFAERRWGEVLLWAFTLEYAFSWPGLAGPLIRVVPYSLRASRLEDGVLQMLTLVLVLLPALVTARFVMAALVILIAPTHPEPVSNEDIEVSDQPT